MNTYVGLDVHSKQTFFHVQSDSGDSLAEGTFETQAVSIMQWAKDLELPQGTPIGLETGTQMHFVAHVLSGCGLKPIVIDAREVRVKARRVGQKCDRRDAFEICDGLRRDIWTNIVWVPPPEIVKLRKILSRRKHFVKVRTMQVNTVKFLMRSHGLKTAGLQLKSARAWSRLLGRKDMYEFAEHAGYHFEVWKLCTRVIGQLECELQQALSPFEQEMDLLRTMPGVALIVGATFIATLGTPDRFSDSSHVASYLGLVPFTYDSGQSERHGHITKRGAPMGRAMLVEAAQGARRITNPFNPYYRKLCVTRGKNKATVAVAHRMARILWRMWRDRQPFDLDQMNVLYDPSTRSKRVLFKLKNSPNGGDAH
jgi:transposase